MSFDSPILQLRAREQAPLGEPARQVVEVLNGGEVIGRLPVTRLSYGMEPGEESVVTISVPVKRADIVSIDGSSIPGLGEQLGGT